MYSLFTSLFTYWFTYLFFIYTYIYNKELKEKSTQSSMEDKGFLWIEDEQNERNSWG